MVEKAPYETAFPGLNAENVVPEAEHIKARWAPTMNEWGAKMKDAYEAPEPPFCMSAEALTRDS